MENEETADIKVIKATSLTSDEIATIKGLRMAKRFVFDYKHYNGMHPVGGLKCLLGLVRIAWAEDK